MNLLCLSFSILRFISKNAPVIAQVFFVIQIIHNDTFHAAIDTKSDHMTLGHSVILNAEKYLAFETLRCAQGDRLSVRILYGLI